MQSFFSTGSVPIVLNSDRSGLRYGFPIAKPIAQYPHTSTGISRSPAYTDDEYATLARVRFQKYHDLMYQRMEKLQADTAGLADEAQRWHAVAQLARDRMAQERINFNAATQAARSLNVLFDSALMQYESGIREMQDAYYHLGFANPQDQLAMLAAPSLYLEPILHDFNVGDIDVLGGYRQMQYYYTQTKKAMDDLEEEMNNTPRQ